MDMNGWAILIGFFACAAVISVTIARQRRFEASDVGSSVASFLAGTNIPPALYLCVYGFSPDPASVATKLHGLEKFVSFAGLALLLVSGVSVWGLLHKAYEVNQSDVAGQAPEQNHSSFATPRKR